MYYSGLCSLNVDDIWNLFESLASYQWQCECTSESPVYPSPPPYDLHAQSQCVDQLRDACDRYSSYPLDACSYCQSFSHDVNSCPSYDVFNESCTKLNALIEIMKERHEHFVSEMREFGLLHKTDISLPIPRLESSLYDDYEPFLPIESNVVYDISFTNLEAVFAPPLTSLPLFAPFFSSTPVATSISDSTLLAYPLPLAQCTRLEMDEISRVMLVF